MAQSEVIELLKQYCLLLNISGIKVDKAFLYGSYAHNEATKDSDIDIMLVSKMFDANEADANIKAWSFTRKVDSRIEPYTVGLQQFLNDNDSPLLQIVKKEGIEINFSL
jgi:predicted nucleotidyltransferase